VAVVGVAVGGAVAPDGNGRGHLRVAAAQGGGKRGVRAVKSDPQLVFDRQLRASERATPPVDLVLWPEDVIDVARLTRSPEERAVGALARRLDATVVAGIVEDAGSDHFRNAAVVWAPDGRVVARYDKVHRVPFGEYIPFRNLIRHLADLSSVPRDERSGRGPGRLDTPVGRLAVVVSYEVFFGDRARSGIRAGGRLLLVPTNASSFKSSQVPGQEVAAARLRAIEGGRWVVQAAPTGYTAVVDQRGRVRARSRLAVAATVQRTVGLRRGRTLATRLGQRPVTAAALVALAGLALGARPRGAPGSA